MTRVARTGWRGSTPLALMASAYVLAVASIATAGFVAESTRLILLAALLSLPASVIALPAYYAAYGLLAQVPGANPSDFSSSSRFCADGTDCITGNPAVWFQITTNVLGIVALTCAALVNVFGLYLVARRRYARGAVDAASVR
jgi:hypothetical protein